MYLGYSLVKSTLTEHLAKVYLAFGLVFAALGLVIGGSALLAVYRIDKEEREGDTPKQNPELSEKAGEGGELSAQEESEDGESVPVQENQKSSESVPPPDEQTAHEKEEKVQ